MSLFFLQRMMLRPRLSSATPKSGTPDPSMHQSQSIFYADLDPTPIRGTNASAPVYVGLASPRHSSRHFQTKPPIWLTSSFLLIPSALSVSTVSIKRGSDNAPCSNHPSRHDVLLSIAVMTRVLNSSGVFLAARLFSKACSALS